MILFLFTMYGHQVKIIMLHYVTNSQSFDIKFVENENFFYCFINQVFKNLHYILSCEMLKKNIILILNRFILFYSLSIARYKIYSIKSHFIYEHNKYTKKHWLLIIFLILTRYIMNKIFVHNSEKNLCLQRSLETNFIILRSDASLQLSLSLA